MKSGSIQDKCRVPDPQADKTAIKYPAAADIEYFRHKNAYYYGQLGNLLRHLIPQDRRILDLGCGDGDFLHLLRPSYGIGVDINPDLVARARSRYPNLHFVEGDIEKLELPDEPFDYILLSNTIGYLKDVQKLFMKMRRYVRPQTRIVIVYYNYLWEPVLKLAERLRLKMKEPYLNWLSVSDIGNLLELAGFEALKKKQSILIPINIPLISGIVNRYISNFPFFWRMALVHAVVARPIFSGVSAEDFSCSVIVPARNEKGTIEELVRRLPDMGSHTEIIFVEGHSEDGTLDEIIRVKREFASRAISVLTQEGEGKADAVRRGLSNASGDICMILDADLSVSPEDLPKFFEAVATGRGELVMGCRLVYQRQDESMRFLNLLGNKFFGMAFSYLLGQRIKDTLCGAKAFARHNYALMMQWRSYFGNNDPFGDFDLIFGAVKANLRIIEIPVRYHARRYGSTQIRRFHHGFMLVKMVGIALRKLKFVRI